VSARSRFCAQFTRSGGENQIGYSQLQFPPGSAQSRGKIVAAAGTALAIRTANREYGRWPERELHNDIVEADLDKKARK
jgi:hypothetical protein